MALSLSPWTIRGPSDKERYWKSVETDRARFEKKNYRRALKALNEAANVAAGAVASGSDPYKAIDKSKAMRQAYEAIWLETGLHFAERTFGIIKATDPKIKKSWIQRILKLIRDGIVADMIVNVQDTTKEVVRRLIQQGVEEGLSIAKIARKIRADMSTGPDAMNKVRATRIARTETVRASNYGSLEGARTVGEGVKKFWIATHDPRVRSEHLDAESLDPVPLDGTFSVGGEELEYPGDPAGSAASTVNCRCTVGYKTPDA